MSDPNGHNPNPKIVAGVGLGVLLLALGLWNWLPSFNRQVDERVAETVMPPSTNPQEASEASAKKSGEPSSESLATKEDSKKDTSRGTETTAESTKKPGFFSRWLGRLGGQTPETIEGDKNVQKSDAKTLPGTNQAGSESSKLGNRDTPDAGVTPNTGSGATEAVAPPCKTVSFKLKKVDKTDMDSPVHTVKLPEAFSAIKGLCLRIEGNPVSFQKNKDKSDELVIHRVMEDSSEIQAYYCANNGKPCRIECKAKKDEFMEALAGGDSPEDIQGELLKGDGWGDSKSAENDRKLAHEVSDLADALRELQKQRGLRIPTWVKTDEKPGCEIATRK